MAAGDVVLRRKPSKNTRKIYSRCCVLYREEEEKERWIDDLHESISWY